jgi:hypothetical protein
VVLSCLTFVASNNLTDVLCRDLKQEFSTPPEILMEYVDEKKLHKTVKDCKWFEQHMGAAVPVEIIGHRNKGKCQDVLVEYDDGDKIWEPLDDLRADSKLLVGKYAKVQCLAGKEDGWKKTRNLWLREIQESIFVQREYEVGLLISRTFGMWKKSCHDYGPNSVDALIWGRAYKDANELVKHGGKVKLPYEFYNKIVGRNKKDCKFISLLEQLYGYVDTTSSVKNSHSGLDNEERVVLSVEQVSGDSGWGRASSAAVAIGRQVESIECSYGDSVCDRPSIVQSPVNNRENSSVEASTDGWGRSVPTGAHPVTPTNALGRAAAAAESM